MPQDEIKVGGKAYVLPPLRLHAAANTVDMEVVVRSANGSPVAGLEERNFVIRDGGKPRPLTYFAVRQQPAAVSRPGAAASAAGSGAAPADFPPRSILLFFDDYNTGNLELGRARNAAAAFVAGALAPGDAVAVISASHQVGLGFGRDAAAIAAALRAIHAQPRQSATGAAPCPRITPYDAYLISQLHDTAAEDAAAVDLAVCEGRSAPLRDELPSSTGVVPPEVAMQADAGWDQARIVSQNTLDALGQALDLLLQRPPGRVLVLASSGFLTGTLDSEQDAIAQRALRAGVVINSLDASGLRAEPPGPAPGGDAPPAPLPIVTAAWRNTVASQQQQQEDAAMAGLAESTGGLFFRNNNDIGLGFRRLALRPDLDYELGFTPASTGDGRFHPVSVAVEPPIPGATVQARPGYFAGAAAAGPADLADTIANALRNPPARSQVAASLEEQPAPGGVRVDIQFQVAKLDFISAQDRRRQALVVVAGLFDSRGHFAAGRQGEMQLALRPATWQRLRREGLHASLNLAAPAGSYQLRVVVVEAEGGKMSSFTRNLALP